LFASLQIHVYTLKRSPNRGVPKIIYGLPPVFEPGRRTTPSAPVTPYWRHGEFFKCGLVLGQDIISRTSVENVEPGTA